MIQLKCPSCGAAMDVDHKLKEAICPYCGSKTLLELAKGEKSKLNIIAETEPDLEQEDADTFERCLYSTEGEKIEMQCLMQKTFDDYEMFVTKTHILYRFAKEKTDAADAFVEGVSMIRYPDEDMEKKMHYYLPKITASFDLADGEKLVVIDKLEYVFPLSQVGILSDRHMAWIVSRLENMACLLDYSGITLEGLTTDDVYIEPIHHQVLLYGGWQKAKKEFDGKSILKEIRQIAKEIISIDGKHLPSDLPEQLNDFIKSQPKENAPDDFTYWDYCLDHAYERRQFVHLKLIEREVYQK